MLNVLFSFFQGKINFDTASGRSGRLQFLFWLSSTISLCKMKSLFFNSSTSPSVFNLSIDYGGNYELVYSFKDLR